MYTFIIEGHLFTFKDSLYHDYVYMHLLIIKNGNEIIISLKFNLIFFIQIVIHS